MDTHVLPKDISTDFLPTNLSKHIYQEDFLELPAVKFAMMASYCVTISLSIIGNTFLIVYILKKARFSQYTSSILILNLTICDLIRSTVLSPIKTIELWNSRDGRNVSEDFCRTMTFFVLLLAFVGFHTVVAISQEHLLLICFPFKARSWLNYKTIGWVLVFIWLSAIAISLAFTLKLSQSLKITLTSGLTFSLCTATFVENRPTSLGKGLCTFVFLYYYVVPVVIVTVSYIKIFNTLLKNEALSVVMEDSIAAHAPDNLSVAGSSAKVKDRTSQRADIDALSKDQNLKNVSKLLESRRSLAKMMMVIAICFVIFNGPIFFVVLYMSWGYMVARNAALILFVIRFLPIISSLVNPVVYLARYKTLRRNIGSYVSTDGRK